jgi:hypothetical protein
VAEQKKLYLRSRLHVDRSGQQRRAKTSQRALTLHVYLVRPSCQDLAWNAGPLLCTQGPTIVNSPMPSCRRSVVRGAAMRTSYAATTGCSRKTGYFILCRPEERTSNTGTTIHSMTESIQVARTAWWRIYVYTGAMVSLATSPLRDFLQHLRTVRA